MVRVRFGPRAKNDDNFGACLLLLATHDAAGSCEIHPGDNVRALPYLAQSQVEITEVALTMG